jgi:hypothetical protein
MDDMSIAVGNRFLCGPVTLSVTVMVLTEDRLERIQQLLEDVAESVKIGIADDRCMLEDTADELVQLGLERPTTGHEFYLLAYEAGVENPFTFSTVDLCFRILTWARRIRTESTIREHTKRGKSDDLWTVEQFCEAYILSKKSFQNKKSEHPLPLMEGNSLPKTKWREWVSRWPRGYRRGDNVLQSASHACWFVKTDNGGSARGSHSGDSLDQPSTARYQPNASTHPAIVAIAIAR